MARAFGSSPSMTSGSFLIKRIYERYLAPYEQVGPGRGDQCGLSSGVSDSVVCVHLNDVHLNVT
jgi:hypothetical protein